MEPGDSFQAPEAVIAWTADGLGALSDAYHRLFRTRLARGPWRDRPRPVLLNNWEGTYFDFDEERIVAIAQASKDLGAELFVLDDGWFGDRNDDHRALGDWFVNTTKLPGRPDGPGQAGDRPGHRLRHLDRARDGQRGQRAVPGPPRVDDRGAGRHRTETRNQLVLDMSNPVVVDHLATTLIDVLQGPRSATSSGTSTGTSPSRSHSICRPSARASSTTGSCSACTSSTGA